MERWCRTLGQADKHHSLEGSQQKPKTNRKFFKHLLLVTNMDSFRGAKGFRNHPKHDFEKQLTLRHLDRSSPVCFFTATCQTLSLNRVQLQLNRWKTLLGVFFFRVGNPFCGLKGKPRAWFWLFRFPPLKQAACLQLAPLAGNPQIKTKECLCWAF